MDQFIAKFKNEIMGAISGLDRLVFRATPRRLMYSKGMEEYLWQSEVLFQDYEQHVKKISERLRKASLSEYQKLGLPVVYVRSSDTDKEALARAIAAERKILSGPVCALKCLEPSPTFEHRGKSMVSRTRPCLVIYHYCLDPEYGWMNARIQTWFPFHIQVCLNGREWLARQMDREGLRYYQQGNCFPWLENYPRAQELLHAQLQVNWVERLQPIAQKLNPLHEQIFQKYPAHHYWTCHQSEWATDMVFQSGALRRLEPLFMQHGLLSFSSADVLQFLGKKVNQSGEIPGWFNGAVTTDFKRRQEGERVKYRLNGNSLKDYGKAHTPVGDVFRVETTVHQPAQFPVYRPKQGGPADQLAWRPLRKGVADMYRRAEVSQKANERYLNALSQIDDSARLQQFIQPLEQRREWKGKRVRALRPFDAADNRLLEVVNRGEFAINGLRNRDLQRLLYDQPAESPQEQRQRSAAVSRKLRLLRAHGLIQKVPKTHRYQVTAAGRQAIIAVLTVQHTSLRQLNAAVAA